MSNILGLFDYTDQYSKIIEFYTEKFGIIGGFILSFIENIFPPLPIFAIVIANVSAFGGVFGFFISFSGHFLGAYLVFIFFRVIIKPRLLPKLKPSSRILRFERWFGERSFPAILIVLSLPFVPYFLINIAAALSNIGKRKYMIALFIGNAFMVCFLSFVGVTFNKALSDRNFIALLYPLVLILLAYITGKIIERKFSLE